MSSSESSSDDLLPQSLIEFDWSQEPSADLFQELFRMVEARTIGTISWYLREKERKARWSRVLRIMSVIGAAFGAVTPLLAQISDSVSLVWGYLAIGFAALALGIEKALGFSTTWSRYMRTAILLQEVLSHAQLEWVKVSTSPESKLDQNATWSTLIGLSDAVSKMVSGETEEWSTDISVQLSFMEARARA